MVEVKVAEISYLESYHPKVGDVCWVTTHPLLYLKNEVYMPFQKYKLRQSPYDETANDIASINNIVRNETTYTVSRFPAQIKRVWTDGFNHESAEFESDIGKTFIIKQKGIMENSDAITIENFFNFTVRGQKSLSIFRRVETSFFD